MPAVTPLERFRRIPTPILALGDAAAVALFAVLGLLTHERGITVDGLLRNAVPIVGGWALAAAALRVYSRPTPVRLVGAWLVGITVGVAVRALLLERDVDEDQFVFLGVTVAVTGGLLLAWRALAWVTVRARDRDR
jgi:hypothetical protein